MRAACGHCSRILEYSGERPSFCAYCGRPLGNPNEQETIAHTPRRRLDSTIARTDPGDDDEPQPTEVAGYRLIRRLGEGGMGTVYEAEDGRLGRRVALKLISLAHSASREAVERFRQEGRLAATLAHRRCVFVLGADEEKGRPYIVMELMPGSTLQTLVREKGPLPAEEAAAKILDVIEGLSAAHRLGIVHRDVKPSNCFLTADGRVKVGDFGLSKYLAIDSSITRTGAFLGTPLYASPEQIRRDPVDERTDIYSTAATLYYLLVGKAPFQHYEAEAAMARIVSEQAPSIRDERPEISRALDQVVLRGLERDPQKRWRTLDEFRAALLPFAPGQLSIAGLGLRIVAYVIDLTLLLALGAVLAFFRLHFGSIVESVHHGARFYARLFSMIQTVLWLIYFVPMDGLLGWTPGKRLTRLRVWSADSPEPPGLAKSLRRFALFYGLAALPSQLVLRAVLLFHKQAGPWLGLILPILITLGLAILASTMRKRNGYRGLHDLIAGTRLVLLPGAERRRTPEKRRPVGRGRTLSTRPAGVLRKLGPYQVRGAVRWDDGGKVLAAEDSSLGREVWIELRPKNAAEPTANRRDLSRPSRPRWLDGGRQTEGRWDAYVAPSGCPLADLAGMEGLPWIETRPILIELADELTASVADGTLPERLTIDQIWIEPDGTLQLVDPLGGVSSGAADEGESDPNRRATRFLAEAAGLSLEGGARRDRTKSKLIRAAVPIHARRILDRLLENGPPYATVADAKRELEATQALPTELGLAPRLVRLVGYVYGMIARLGLVLFLVYAWDRTSTDAPWFPLDPASPSRVWKPAAICLIAWPLWAFATRGGLASRVTGMGLVRSDGAIASRLRCAWREALAWSILLALVLVIEELMRKGPAWGISDWFLRLLPLFALLWPLIDAAHELFFPGRMLHDRLGGTVRVPL